MNKGCRFFFLTSVFVLAFVSCVGGASVGSYAGNSARITSTVAFTDIQQKTWALV
jgi:hypothetical protein